MDQLYIEFTFLKFVVIIFNFTFQKRIIEMPVINFKSKQNKTIDIWKNMTILDVANATAIPVGKLYFLCY